MRSNLSNAAEVLVRCSNQEDRYRPLDRIHDLAPEAMVRPIRSVGRIGRSHKGLGQGRCFRKGSTVWRIPSDRREQATGEELTGYLPIAGLSGAAHFTGCRSAVANEEGGYAAGILSSWRADFDNPCRIVSRTRCGNPFGSFFCTDAMTSGVAASTSLISGSAVSPSPH